jgi:hypothetical protein
MRRRPADLEPAAFPSVSWEPKDRAQALEALVGYATGEAERAIEWYYWKRRRMQRWGRGLRLAAILATSAAGITPLLTELFQRNDRPAIDPLWGAFLLAGAGIFVLLDRFWGCTSAWVRYVLAAQEISSVLDAFRMDWESHKLLSDPLDPDVEQAQLMIDRCRSFLSHVRSVVRAETDAWAAEFQNVLEQIEGSTHPRVPRDTPPPAR